MKKLKVLITCGPTWVAIDDMQLIRAKQTNFLWILSFLIRTVPLQFSSAEFNKIKEVI